MWKTFTSETITFLGYKDDNFMIAMNPEELGITEELLQARVTFTETQPASELTILWVPIRTKTLKIDQLMKSLLNKFGLIPNKN